MPQKFALFYNENKYISKWCLSILFKVKN